MSCTSLHDQPVTRCFPKTVFLHSAQCSTFPGCRPDAIDPALRRPGRFDRECYFGLPSQPDRAAIVRVHTARCATLFLSVSLSEDPVLKHQTGQPRQPERTAVLRVHTARCGAPVLQKQGTCARSRPSCDQASGLSCGAVGCAVRWIEETYMVNLSSLLTTLLTTTP